MVSSSSNIASHEFDELKPGRFALQQLSPFLFASILDAPATFHPSSPFAAILVPRGQEEDWIFCVPNGLWDLLFSASVSRLVVLRRELTQTGHNQLALGIPNHYHALHSHTGSSVSYPTPKFDENNADVDDQCFEKEASASLHSLFPWRAFPDGPSCDLFVTYEDWVVNRIVVDIQHSPYVGDILIEDVEIDPMAFEEAIRPREIQIRRRMRFKGMPNLIQTEVRAIIFKDGKPQPNCTLDDVRTVIKDTDDAGKGLEVRPDHSKLVHKYLPPIVAGLILVSPSLELCIKAGHRVRVLSIGLGGGALPIFLCREFGFHVLAVDLDDMVLELARRHFGLQEDGCLEVKLQDGVDVVLGIAKEACSASSVVIPEDWEQSGLMPEGFNSVNNSSSETQHVDRRMHVIVLDVNAEDACLGLVAPPSCFLSRTFFLATRLAILDGGMLVINVIPRDENNLRTVVHALHEFFAEIYQIHHEDNFVLFALTSKTADVDLNCNFAVKLWHVVDIDLLNQIQQIY